MSKYSEHVINLCKQHREIIDFCDNVVPVFKKFNGKVINKRLNDAIKQATGFTVKLSYSSVEFKNYNGFRYRGDTRDCSINNYDDKWVTNKVFEAEYFIDKIEKLRKYNEDTISDLNKSVLMFLSHVVKCREVVKQIEELNKHNHYLVEWVKENVDGVKCYNNVI